jgi:hypothetical protein
MLVDPHSVPDIAAAIVHLLQHPEERVKTALAGRGKDKRLLQWENWFRN